MTLFVKAEVTKIIVQKWYFQGESCASNPPPLLLSLFSVQTVCQDGGDEADDEDQQVGCPLAAHQSHSHKQ